VVVALTTRPLVRYGSSPREDPSARQVVRPAELWVLRSGSWWRSFVQAQALALQELPSPLSTLHRLCNSLCGCHRSHTTEAIPAGLSTHRRGGSHHKRRTGCVSAVTLRSAEALTAFPLQRALGSHVLLHRHSQTAEFGDRSHLGKFGPSRHRYKVGVIWRSLAGSWSRRPERNA
jgi:hypothetical protein